jgi:hypothetical protein
MIWTISDHDLVLQLDISNAYSTFWDTISQSFQQNSILWILISVGLGAILTAVVKHVFEHSLPEWQQKRAKRIALQKYSFPLTQAAYILCLAIERAIDDIKAGKLHEFSKFEQKSDINPKDDYYCLSILYPFSCFIGWYRILENEAFLEFSKLYEVESNVKRPELSYESYESQQLYPKTGGTTSVLISALLNRNVLINIQLERFCQDIFNDFVGYRLFGRYESPKIPRFALNAIGDLMIKNSEESKKVLGFIEFIKTYNNDRDFRKCLTYIVDIFVEMEKSSSSSFDMMLSFYLRIRQFLYFKMITTYGQNTNLEMDLRDSKGFIDRWNLKSKYSYYFPEDRGFVLKKIDLLEQLLSSKKMEKSNGDEEEDQTQVETRHTFLNYFYYLAIPILPLVIWRRYRYQKKYKKE